MTQLSPIDMTALAIIADPNAVDTPCRTALEKLSRLDLIVPCNDSIGLSDKGQKLLTKKFK